jgi:hypothetical protein
MVCLLSVPEAKSHYWDEGQFSAMCDMYESSLYKSEGGEYYWGTILDSKLILWLKKAHERFILVQAT